MNATPDDSAPSCSVRIIPYQGEWCISFGSGHYAVPMEKNAAIHRAMELARRVGSSEIAICDKQHRVCEVLTVTPAHSETVADYLDIIRSRPTPAQSREPQPRWRRSRP